MFHMFMRTGRNRRTAAVYTILFSAVVFLPVFGTIVAVTAVSYRSRYRLETAVIESSESQLVQFQATLISNQLNLILEDLKYLVDGDHGLERFIASGFDPEASSLLNERYGAFMKRRGVYRRLRILDSNGRERVRIDHRDGVTIVPPASELEDSSARYFFQAAAQLTPGTIYVSRLDLDPLPVIRFVSPVAGATARSGVLVELEYDGDQLLGRVRRASDTSAGDTMLLSSAGYWLDSGTAGEEWGLASSERENRRFSLRYPDVWETMQSEHRGVVRTPQGLFIHQTAYPLMDPETSTDLGGWRIAFDSNENQGSLRWHLVTLVPAGEIGARLAGYRRRLYGTAAIISSVLLVVSVLLARTVWRRRVAEARLTEEGAVFSLNPAPVLRADASGNVDHMNPAAERVFGVRSGESPRLGAFTQLRKEQREELLRTNGCQLEQRIGDSVFFFTVRRDPRDGSCLFYGSDITGLKLAEQEVKRLSTAVAQSATAVLITDLKGAIIFANQACAENSGYRLEELIGEHTRIFKSGKHGAEVYRDLWSTISGGRVWTGELKNRRKDGSLCWEEMSISPVRDDDGEISCYLAVKEDIAVRKRTEEKLREAMEQAEEVSRLKSEFLANMSHEIRTPMNAILGFTELLKDQEEDTEKIKSLDIIRSSGKHLLELINDILDFSKIEADRIDVSNDVFALRQMIDHLSSMLSESVREKDLYLRIDIADRVPPVVSGDEHRLTQILLNVLGNAVKFTDSGGVTLSCDYAEGTARVRVIDTGIGIASDKLEAIFSPFEQASKSTERTHGGTGLGLTISRRLAELMGGTLYAQSEKGRGSTFVLELPLHVANVDDVTLAEEYPVQPDEARTGADEGREMVERWLSAMGDDALLRDVVLRGTRALPDRVETLSAALARGDVEKLRFVAHDVKGYTGNLGMTEVYRVSRALYDVTRKPSFVAGDAGVYVHQLRRIVALIPEDLLERPPTVRRAGGLPDGASSRILVAEDNPANQELVRILLDRMELSSDIVDDGKSAIEKLERDPSRYAVLLLDMQMPVMDGEQVVRAVRADSRFEHLRVIAVTARAMKEDETHYLDIGCDDYVAKPIDRETFVRKLKKALAHTTADTAPNDPD